MLAALVKREMTCGSDELFRDQDATLLITLAPEPRWYYDLYDRFCYAFGPNLVDTDMPRK